MSESGFVPKYQKIINDFKGMIQRGDLVAGDKIPSRDELVAAYGVTRHTVNRAMTELLREKLLTATQRSGTYVAHTPKSAEEGKIALVVHNDLLMANVTNWNLEFNYFALFGTLLQLIPEQQRTIINLADAKKTPEMLRPYKRILWNSLGREDFERAVVAVGDRSRFLLLNRYYPDCNFISINHRQAAFELADAFLSALRPGCLVGIVNVNHLPPEFVSQQFVLGERRSGFIDACEKHNCFFRLLEMHGENYQHNQEQLAEFDSRRKPGQKALILSPAKDFAGSMLGFWREKNYTPEKEYFYADFDNDKSLLKYGIALTSVIENFAEVAQLAYQNIASDNCQIFIQHKIVNLPDFKSQ